MHAIFILGTGEYEDDDQRQRILDALLAGLRARST